MQFEEQIVQSIRKLLIDKQMKQSQLAELSGMSESTISRILNEGRCLYGNDIANIASALQMNVVQLLHYPRIPLIYFEDEVTIKKITSNVDAIIKHHDLE